MTNSPPNQLAKALQYLRSAEMLVGFGDFDSAASRLYYAMLYAAEAALAAKGVTLKRQRDVLWGFGQHLVKTGEIATELHRWLLDGFDAQQRADRSYQSSLTKTTSASCGSTPPSSSSASSSGCARRRHPRHEKAYALCYNAAC